jgi:hypothetical protein
MFDAARYYTAMYVSAAIKPHPKPLATEVERGFQTLTFPLSA